MKKILITLFTALTAVSLLGCSKPAEPASPTASTAAVDAKNNAEYEIVKEDGDRILKIYVKTEFPILYDAWVGVCPDGEYKDEISADEVDIIYASAEYDFEKEEPQTVDGRYCFEFYLDSDCLVDPGKYTMVFCNTDYEGDVVMQWPFEQKKNGDLAFDFSKIRVNENARKEFEDWD